MIITNLRCEYRVNPLGIDVAWPRLSWELRAEQRGARQSAYQVQVASGEARLLENQPDLWDSGQVDSDQSIHVPYAGAALASGQRACWRVRAWDEAGQPSEWSAPSWWEMGLLERAAWHGQWIGAPFSGGPRTTSPAPFLRTEFALDKPVARARLYASALGVYECRLNGARVGDALLAPGWTDYRQRIQYQVYDVTAMLQPGRNALGSILGDGWAVGHVGWWGRQRYADRPRFLAQLAVTHADGSTQLISTSGQWKLTTGPILESDMLMGESYDARRELAGWDLPGYDDGRWLAAEVFEDPSAALVATNGPVVRQHEELRPVALTEPQTGRWVFDLGQNMVGCVRLRLNGPAGSTVTLRHAEMLNPDGTLYTANLRPARSTDHYTLKGGGEETWQPRFTFHGFRYVELTGYAGRPTEATVTGIVVHSDLPATGAFECSDPLINQLQHNIVWGQKSNFLEVPTDCPQRDERLGWTGDAQVFVRTAAFNRDIAGFFTKWTRDLEDAQSPQGAYPKVAPNPGLHPDHGPATGDDGGPAWADAGIICPWTIYLCYGDTRLLAEHYSSMCRYVDFLAATSRDGRRSYPDYAGWHGYGDWLAMDGGRGNEGATPKELIGTAFFAHSARLLAQIAHVLGKPEDAERYEALFQQARRAFQARFTTPGGLIAGGTQTAHVLALHFDLLPAEMRPAAVEALVRDIERRGLHLSTGFVGTPYLNWVLSDAERGAEHSRLDIAYALLCQTTWPSWLYPVIQGATTIWERWDGWTHDRGFQDPAMNSFNHYAYGAIGAWLYAVVGGIDVDPGRPGYKHIVMRPRPGGGLTRARAELQSVYGLIGSAWTLENGGLEWRINLPANTTATVYVPVSDGATLREGDLPAAEAPGVLFVRRAAGADVYQVGAGEYCFTTR